MDETGEENGDILEVLYLLCTNTTIPQYGSVGILGINDFKSHFYSFHGTRGRGTEERGTQGEGKQTMPMGIPTIQPAAGKLRWRTGKVETRGSTRPRVQWKFNGPTRHHPDSKARTIRPVAPGKTVQPSDCKHCFATASTTASIIGHRRKKKHRSRNPSGLLGNFLHFSRELSQSPCIGMSPS